MSRSGHSMLRSGRKSCIAASTQNVPRENTDALSCPKGGFVYLKGRNFRRQKFSRFLPIFAKLNDAKKIILTTYKKENKNREIFSFLEVF